jgi:hypothetical protein
MKVEVYDKDVTTSDLVGEGQIDLSNLMFGTGQPRNGILKFKHRGCSHIL